MSVSEPVFPTSGKVVLSTLSFLSSDLRQRVLFGSTQMHSLTQKLTQRLLGLGGPVAARIQYTRGPLKGYSFECFTSEQYFLMGSEYEAGLQNTIRQFLKTGDIVYDIGANAGFWSLLFAILIGSSGRVVAFEPSPTNFARLQRNVRLNGVENISCVQEAASDIQGDALFVEKGSGSQLLSHMSPPGEYVRVPTVRLDDHIWRDGYPMPRLLKIDIEGHAGACLSGANQILTKAKPQVLCEIHHSKELSEAVEIFERHSYGLISLDSTSKFPRHILASPC
jgi:FkbM family methyltransferase